MNDKTKGCNIRLGEINGELVETKKEYTQIEVINKTVFANIKTYKNLFLGNNIEAVLFDEENTQPSLDP